MNPVKGQSKGAPIASAARVRPRVAVLTLGERAEVAQEAEQLRPLIERHTEIVVWDSDFSADLSQLDLEFAIVLGGDGSILRATHQMGYRQRPIVGVNLGKLGFLADISPNDLDRVLPRLASGEFTLAEHLMFECRVLRPGVDGANLEVAHLLGLNEVAILAGSPFSILELHLHVDAELVTTYSCDGLIVSTPVGSTAHSLSAGGPILRKELQAFVVSPISPHTLSNRPVVDAADRVYELVVPSPNVGTSAVVDGRVACTLEPGDRVRIERAVPRFQLVEFPSHSYYRTLREKLGWGGRLLPP